MVLVKLKFRHFKEADKEGQILYQISHERKVRLLQSSYNILSSEWDEKRSIVVAGYTNERKILIGQINECIAADIARLSRISRKFEIRGISYSVDDIINEYRCYSQSYSLFAFMENIIVNMKNNGKIRTSETYRSTVNSFKRFISNSQWHNILNSDGDIMLDYITSEIMVSYEAWQKKRGIVPNTISFYNRILRAVYNRAVEADVIEDRKPFRHVYTGIDRTVKRALPLSAVRKLKSVDFNDCPMLDYARDMFLLSFYLRGMSFVDMAYLKKSDLDNGYIIYRRRKTGQRLMIKWTKEMQLILDKYPENTSAYLLPIIKKTDINDHYTYRTAAYMINRNLKKIAALINLDFRLTMYVARHSWASAAKANGIPLCVISEGMGHDRESTTQIYLASLDTKIVDNANSLILKSLG